jgi:hypothetical protein
MASPAVIYPACTYAAAWKDQADNGRQLIVYVNPPSDYPGEERSTNRFEIEALEVVDVSYDEPEKFRDWVNRSDELPKRKQMDEPPKLKQEHSQFNFKGTFELRGRVLTLTPTRYLDEAIKIFDGEEKQCHLINSNANFYWVPCVRVFHVEGDLGKKGSSLQGFPNDPPLPGWTSFPKPLTLLA